MARSAEFTAETEIWSFKGSRVREERWIAKQPDQHPRAMWAYITQCDHKAYYLLDEESKTYQYWSIPKKIMEDRSADSGVRSGTIESDGWYLDLPGWDQCFESGQQRSWQIEMELGHHPRFLERWQSVNRGFPIELTTKIVEVGCPDSFDCHPGAQSPSIEFLEISEDPLDPALFKVPKDYSRVER